MKNHFHWPCIKPSPQQPLLFKRVASTVVATVLHHLGFWKRRTFCRRHGATKCGFLVLNFLQQFDQVFIEINSLEPMADGGSS